MLKKKLALVLVMLMVFSVSYAATEPMDGAERFDIGTRAFVVDEDPLGLVGALHLTTGTAVLQVGDDSIGNDSVEYRMIEAQVHIMTDHEDDTFPLNNQELPKVGKFEYKPDVDEAEGNEIEFDLNAEDIESLDVTTPTFAIAVHIEVITTEDYDAVVEDLDEEEMSIKEFIMMMKEGILEAYDAYLDGEPEPVLTLEEFVDEELTELDLFYFELEIMTGWTTEERFNEDKNWSSYDFRGIHPEIVPEPELEPEPFPVDPHLRGNKFGEIPKNERPDPKDRGNKFGHYKKLDD